MSLSASAENLTSESQSYDGSSSMCLELALEGERLCKSGDCRAGVAFFQAAIQAGTDDLRTLSAIYSQLGNAYFYLGDYGKAMQYHKHDLTLARTMNDKLGEAKSSGNLGNTLKVMGRFDEAVVCCKRHLELSRELNDKLSEGRALYNLGNVYHAKGKHIGRVGHQDPGEFPEDVKSCLQQAVSYYEENLGLMRELGDVAAQGRACGNLGNTHYLLGAFSKAIRYHEERLAIARQFGDRAAERRAHSNLGNSHIFLGQFEDAARHYKQTLALAQDLGDRAVEAQACYSLGNTYTLLRDYETAIEYHLRHLLIAQHLVDRMGEGRACWSLGNAHSALGNHDKALYFATKHLEISRELGDPMGEATAKMNVSDLQKVLGLPESPPPSSQNSTGNKDSNSNSPPSSANNSTSNGGGGTTGAPNSTTSSTSSQRLLRVRRESMEQMHLIKLTPDGKQARPQLVPINISGPNPATNPGLNSRPLQQKPHLRPEEDEESSQQQDDSFFDLLSRFQSKRMDDQRCSLTVDQNNKENTNAVMNHGLQGSGGSIGSSADGPDDLMDLIAGMQSKRMDEQRVALPHLPGLQSSSTALQQRLAAAGTGSGGGASVGGGGSPDDSFLEQLVRCQGSRLEEQRSPLPAAVASTAAPVADDEESEQRAPPAANARGATVPDEDFFSLIMRFQSSGRMDDQRAALDTRIPNGNVPHDVNGPNNAGKKKK